MLNFFGPIYIELYSCQSSYILQIILKSRGNIFFLFLHSSFLHPVHLQVMCSRMCSGVNELNNEGETPLHVACRLGRVECVKALLGGGAKCDIIGGAGYPIHGAMKYSEKW